MFLVPTGRLLSRTKDLPFSFGMIRCPPYYKQCNAQWRVATTKKSIIRSKLRPEIRKSIIIWLKKSQWRFTFESFFSGNYDTFWWKDLSRAGIIRGLTLKQPKGRSLKMTTHARSCAVWHLTNCTSAQTRIHQTKIHLSSPQHIHYIKSVFLKRERIEPHSRARKTAKEVQEAAPQGHVFTTVSLALLIMYPKSVPSVIMLEVRRKQTTAKKIYATDFEVRVKNQYPA